MSGSGTAGRRTRWPRRAALLALALAPAVMGVAKPARAADGDVPLVTAAELRTRLAALRGQVVILNLWATWCVPCLREIPDLLEVEAQLQARGVRLVGLAMDEPEQRTTLVAPFRAQHFPRFQTLLRNEPDMDSLVSVIDPAWNEILPTTYLIGRDGRVFRKIQGRRSVAEFVAMLEPALQAPP